VTVHSMNYGDSALNWSSASAQTEGIKCTVTVTSPALQHVVMTIGSSVTVVGLGMFNTSTFAAIEQSLERWHPLGATDVSS
jgi:hypothetical protein